MRWIRDFFHERAFNEVETPILVPGTSLEPHIDPITAYIRLHPDEPPRTRFLHTSPELALKRILARTTLKKIFQISKVFRDGEKGPLHLPEFTLLEWYRVGATLDELMEDCETLVLGLAQELDVALTGPWSQPFERYALPELFLSLAKIDLLEVLAAMKNGDDLALVKTARAQGFTLRKNAHFEDAFFHIMGTRIEKEIGRTRPAFISGWPAQMAVLARLDPEEPLLARRFELYAQGMELANAFDELCDPEEQRRRFLADNARRRELSKSPLPIDELFLEDLQNLPACCGIAMGLDRLLMALCGAKTIQEIAGLPWR